MWQVEAARVQHILCVAGSAGSTTYACYVVEAKKLANVIWSVQSNKWVKTFRSDNAGRLPLVCISLHDLVAGGSAPARTRYG